MPFKKWVRRQYQKVALVAVRKVRAIVLFWARQCRKSTTLGDIAFDDMSREPGRNVIAASASLLTGSELISKALTATEQAQICARQALAVQAAMVNGTAQSASPLQLKYVNSETGKVYAKLTADDFVDLYRTSKLEMRLYHDRTAYSRLLVIAPNPATARGWTGMVVRDEAGFTHPNLERDLQVAVKPIMDTDPSFKLIYASNLCRDDRHPFFEMTLPDPGLEFPANADGHFYRGQHGILIHRVALADAYAAGHVLYDTQEGKPMSYDEFCAAPENKLGLDESYRLIHKFGGAAAIDLFALLSAQRRGIGQCALFVVDSDLDFERGLSWLATHLSADPVGVGIDPATTTNQTSNPTGVTVSQRRVDGFYQPAVFVWKEKNPKVARERIARILDCIRHSPAGRVRRCCLAITNEQYFGRETAQDLGHLAPFELVDERCKVEPVPAGYKRDPNYKTWLADQYAAQVNDNHYTMPPEEYYKNDQRMVVKTGGSYECEPGPDGQHGDTFVSGAMGQHALSGAGGALTSTEGIFMGESGPGRRIFLPRRLG